jgi:hypothetical protein
VVLIRRFALLVLVMLAGCNQSLFDAHGAPGGGGGGTGPDGGMVASSCPNQCLADAAADFDGTTGGKGNHWAYLEDHRDRTWAAMTTGAAMTLTGATADNHITTCAAKSSAPACQALPGALLVSTAGKTTPADPAVAFTVKSNAVLQITLKAAVPAGGDTQQIRVYRNSREDALYTGSAIGGGMLEQAITLDAVTGDRFLVAVAPTGAGAADVGLQVFISDTGTSFPTTCQVAVQFTAATGNTVDNVCGADFTYTQYNDTGADTPIPPVLANDGPFLELGSVASLTASTTTTPPIPGTYFKGASVLDKNQDITLQFWVKLRTPPVGDAGAWVFSDIDFDDPIGGLAVLFTTDSPPKLDVNSFASVSGTTATAAEAIAPYPADGGWHFIRAVYTGGILRACIDGPLVASTPVPAMYLKSPIPPDFGRNEFGEPAGAHFDGEIDDLRVLTGALPCN